MTTRSDGEIALDERRRARGQAASPSVRRQRRGCALGGGALAVLIASLGCRSARRRRVDAGDRRDDLLLGVAVDVERRRAAAPSRRTKIRSATSKTSTRLWLITTTPRPRSRRRRISSSTCVGLGDPERRGRLVQQHHLGFAQQRAGDRDLLALAAGERPDLAAQAGDRHREVGEQLDRSRAPSLTSSSWRETGRPARPPRGRGRGWRRRRGCRRAPGPDRRSRSRARSRLGGGDRDLAAFEADTRPRRPGGCPAIVLTSVDLPAPLSPTRPTTSPGMTRRSTPFNARTAPNRL